MSIYLGLALLACINLFIFHCGRRFERARLRADLSPRSSPLHPSSFPPFHAPTPHRIVCAWCSDVMQGGCETASHSICEDCTHSHFPQFTQKKQSA